ncbi:hypothetical protein D9615_007190 [Tricholomella constricta]|uniref:Meiotically up-regulated protein Msb1/Mug8 domain-containing protein n=1 Tax=Tricholomella constricta TaxID=117010 RepID=A0A8H5H8D7_9AGAR|nr:hypothetical protein D9615_007190 [Tricholomella constricta]
MPSFLSKVFGRKKDDKESPRSPGRVSDPELLDGKFESVSPSATKFPEVANGKGVGQGKEKEKDASFTLFRTKSRPASPDIDEKRVNIPLLSLNLPGPKGDSPSRALGAVFEADLDAQILLSDAAIGSRRLNPLETLILVRACSQAITARGLETLGIMHPHWYSASPEIQRKLISLFIQSLAPKSPINTLSPTPSAFVTAFESEISSTRSPHDVAAVLRWGLRHLQLEGNSFGKEDTWYNTFFDAERSSEYPANGFSTILGPTLPASHLELLTATLEIFSSLAAHAEANGISGSKLSKFFGLWLLTVQRAHESDDWATFYARWERTGRILEHLFLSRIRNEAVGSRMPTRLLELVKQYPYNKAPSPETDLLARPRFSTRQYDALFVRIETELSATADQPAHHPLRLISEAFRAEATADAGEHVTIWEIIRKAGTDESNPSPGSYPGLSRIFADETLRFFSLIPIENGAKEPTSPSFNLFIRPTRRRSFSLNQKDSNVASTATATSNGILKHAKPATDPSGTPVPAIGTDWATFSTSGFFEDENDIAPLAATLLDKEKDMEVTVPKKVAAPRSKPIVSSLANGRKSLDAPRTLTMAEEPKPEESVKTVSKSTHVSLTQLDEAFIDFWSDALLDPISSTWPAFIICKLKTTLAGVEIDGKRLEWLVIEQTFKRPAPPTPVSPETATTSSESARRARPSSPKSFKSDMTFSSTRKRFSFFTSGRTSISSEKGTKSKKKAGQSPRVGEMGEILAEEDENKEKEKAKEQTKKEKVDTGTVRVRIPSPKPKKSADVPRKSVDAGKKSMDVASKTNGVDAAGLAAGAAVVVTGAAAVAAIVSSETVKSEEAAPTNGAAVKPTAPAEAAPSTEPVVPEVPVTTTTVAPAAIAEETAAATNGSAKTQEVEVSAAAPEKPADQAALAPSEADLVQSPANPSARAPTPEAAVEELVPAVEPAPQPELTVEEPTEPTTAVEDTKAAEVPAPAGEVIQPAPAIPAVEEPVEPTPVAPSVEAGESVESKSAEPSITPAEVPAEDSGPAAVVELAAAEPEATPEIHAEEVASPAPAAVAEPEATPEVLVVEETPEPVVIVESTPPSSEVAETEATADEESAPVVAEPEVVHESAAVETDVEEEARIEEAIPGVAVTEPVVAPEEAVEATPIVPTEPEVATLTEEPSPVEPEVAPAAEPAPAPEVEATVAAAESESFEPAPAADDEKAVEEVASADAPIPASTEEVAAEPVPEPEAPAAVVEEVSIPDATPAEPEAVTSAEEESSPVEPEAAPTAEPALEVAAAEPESFEPAPAADEAAVDEQSLIDASVPAAEIEVAAVESESGEPALVVEEQGSTDAPVPAPTEEVAAELVPEPEAPAVLEAPVPDATPTEPEAATPEDEVSPVEPETAEPLPAPEVEATVAAAEPDTLEPAPATDEAAVEEQSSTDASVPAVETSTSIEEVAAQLVPEPEVAVVEEAPVPDVTSAAAEPEPEVEAQPAVEVPVAMEESVVVPESEPEVAPVPVHSEPLNVPEDQIDEGVTLPAPVVVEVESTAPVVEESPVVAEEPAHVEEEVTAAPVNEEAPVKPEEDLSALTEETEAPVDAPVEVEASPKGDAIVQPAGDDTAAPTADGEKEPVQAAEEPKEKPIEKTSAHPDSNISADTDDTTSSALTPQE